MAPSRETLKFCRHALLLWLANMPGTIKPGQVNDDLICFSDFFPTMVEAAGLPPKTIGDGDGWSFWPQCLGEKGKKRHWIYCYYFPRPSARKYDNKYSHYEVRFTRNTRYKLYDNGKLFDVIDDVLEKRPIAVGAAGERGETSRKILQQALDSYPKAGRAANRRPADSAKKPKKKG